MATQSIRIFPKRKLLTGIGNIPVNTIANLLSPSPDVPISTILQFGVDANKPTSPSVGIVWLSTDTSKLLACFAAGTWTTINP